LVNVNLKKAFWKIEKRFQDLYKKLPIWIFFDKNETIHYGFPSFEYKDKIKASIHTEKDILMDPDNNNFLPNKNTLKKSKKFLEKTFNGTFIK
jgi:hypothetical protein